MNDELAKTYYLHALEGHSNMFKKKVKQGKWFTVTLKTQRLERKDDFESYVEPFRSLNDDELLSLARKYKNWQNRFSKSLVSYQAQVGGFTICNILVNGRLYTGSSHCIKSDRWLKIRGQMIAFRRALESEGIILPATATEGEKSND